MRALQGGYIAKMPAAFAAHWPKLKHTIEQLAVTPITLSSSSETEDLALDMLEQVTTHVKSSQGFSVDPERRKAIGDYAVDRAKNYFEKNGCSQFEDRGKPYNFHCVAASGSTLYVEVKGTTSAGEAVFLTHNELEFHRKHIGATALYVLSAIEVTQQNGKMIATDGNERVFWPWLVDKCKLEAFAYTCKLSAAASLSSGPAP